MSEQREMSRETTPPVDRFDSLPKRGRVGAHRIVGRARTAWRWVLATVLTIAILVTVGIFWVNSLGSSSARPAPTTSNGAQGDRVEPLLDPTATIAVLNGSPTPTLASGVDEAITANGWGQIVFAGFAAATDVQISAVFYADPADEAAAEGLAQKLGGMSTYQSNDYDGLGVRLVVLLGSDYVGPGVAEAERIAEQLESEDVAPLDENWVPPTAPYIPPPPPFVPDTDTQVPDDTDLPPLDDGGEGSGDGSGDGSDDGGGASDGGQTDPPPTGEDPPLTAQGGTTPVAT